MLYQLYHERSAALLQHLRALFSFSPLLLLLLVLWMWLTYPSSGEHAPPPPDETMSDPDYDDYPLVRVVLFCYSSSFYHPYYDYD